MEKKLQENERLFRTIADYTYDWESWHDPNGRLLWVNPAVHRLTGYTPEECRAMFDYPLPLIDTRDREMMAGLIAEGIKGSSANDVEFRIRCKDGSLKWGAVSWQSIYDTDGSRMGLRSSVRDITERKRTEEALNKACNELELRVQERTGELLKCSTALEERFCFEELVAELSSRYINIRPSELDDEVARSLNLMREFFDARFCYLMEVLAESRQVRIVPEAYASKTDQGGAHIDVFASSPVIYHRVVDQGEPIVMSHDAAMAPGFAAIQDILEAVGVYYGLLIPVSVTGRVTHVIVLLGNDRFDLWPQAYLHHVRLLGEIFAKAFMSRSGHEALTRSESTLARAQRIAHVGSWEWDIDTGKLDCSDETYRIFGLVPRQFDVTFATFLATVHSDDRAKVEEAVDELLAKRRKGEGLEHRIILPDGSERTVFLRGECIFDDHGKPIRMIGTVLDVTGRKKAEKALVMSERKYRELVENANSVIIRWSRDGTISFINEYGQTFFGYSADELIGRKANIIVPQRESTGTDLSTLVQDIIDNPERYVNNINENVCRDGRRVWMTWTNKPIFDEHGAVTEVLAIGNDITKQKQAEVALKKSELRLIEAQRIARVGSWEWDIGRDIHNWSEGFYRIFGLSSKEVNATYERMLASVHPNDRQRVHEANTASISDPQKPYSCEYRVVLPDGTERIIHARGEVLFDRNGKAIRMIGTAQDMTDRKQAEEALQKAFDEIKKLKEQLEAENIYLRDEIEVTEGSGEIIGTSDVIKYVMYRARQVARTRMSVLLTGETGTGKGIFARFLHKESDRRDKPFVIVNCAGLPANLIESELFGREKGAFTGSTARQIGRFELANKGTIFLDEIGELPIELQAKLLRVIEDGEFERLGSPHTVKVDVRIIASTNRNLEEETKKGGFRQDLFFRLNVFPITIPTLRQRKGDISLLAKSFVQKFVKTYGKDIKRIPVKTMESLEQYAWPGNVRELLNVIERAVIVSDGPDLRLAEKITTLPADSPGETAPRGGMARETKALAEAEREYILEALQKTGWKIDGVGGAARFLDLHPNTLRSRMKKLGIKRPAAS